MMYQTLLVQLFADDMLLLFYSQFNLCTPTPTGKSPTGSSSTSASIVNVCNCAATTSILEVRAAGLNQEGTEGALAMTYRTPPALEATSLPLGVQFIPASAPAVHPHDTQGGEKIRVSTSMTSEEEKFEDNSRNKIPTVNDASAKASASTAGVKLSASLTTTTTIIANDCSQTLASGVSSPGRCGTIFFVLFFFWPSIFFSTMVTLKLINLNHPPPIIAYFFLSFLFFPAQAVTT